MKSDGVDAALIETLLHMSESDVLDFKRKQYPRENATDEQRGEIVKDIVAFANAWKTTDAYILLGVDENPGGRAVVVGVESHINDATLQQLVNCKTNRPVSFEYIPLTVDGLPIGVIRIAAQQQRPIWLKKRFGGCEAEKVYIRRGSSTAIADPDEVSKMGASAAVATEPQIDLQFAALSTKDTLGQSLTVRSRVLEERPPMPARQILPAMPDIFGAARLAVLSASLKFPSIEDLYKQADPAEILTYRKEIALLKAVGFCVHNVGTQLVQGIRVLLCIPKLDGLRVMAECPKKPTRLVVPAYPQRSNISVESAVDGWEITAKINRVQPGATSFSEPFWIGSDVEQELSLVARVFGDNIPRPVDVPLVIRIQVEKGWLEDTDDSGDVEETA